MTRSEEINSISLTEEEIELALWQAKFVKWNRERFKDYWNEQEKKKPKQSCTVNVETNQNA